MFVRVGIILLAVFAAVDAGAAEHIVRTAEELAQVLRRKPYRWTQFDLTATVTFPPGPRCRNFAAEDATGPVVMREASTWPKHERKPLPVLLRGDRIHVKGYVNRHSQTDTSVAEVRVLEVLSHEPMPPMPCVKAENLVDRELQDRPVRLHGVVVDAFRDEIDTCWNYIVVRSGRETVYAALTTDGTDGENLRSIVGAEVELEGLNTLFNTGNRRLIGRMFMVHGWSSVKVLRPAPEDPFAAPDLDAAHGETIDAVGGAGRRKAAGRVIAVWHGNRVLLKTRGGRIVRVDMAERKPPRYGETIEAVGAPETDLYRLNLSRAIWRRSHGRTEEDAPPKDVTPRDLTVSEFGVKGFQTDYHGKPVRMTGIVRSLPSPDEGRFSLECDRHTVPIDASSCPAAVDGVEIGCRLEVSGTCLMECENWHANAPFPHIEGFAIVVRTPQDVRILARPPWWTPARSLTVIGALLGLLAWASAWNRILNRKAERRGKELADEQMARVTSDLKVYERTRLAVELHDSLSQNLTGVSLAIRAADRLADTDQAAMRKSLGLAAKSLDSCREELRNCLWDLRNRTLEESSLNEAILHTLAPHVGDVRLVIRFNVPRERLSDNTAHSILHIIRELASNAVRHGSATEIRVAGTIDSDILLFSVTDNGCGFDPERYPGAKDGHFGLQGVQDRVDSFEGDFTIESAPGKGAKASISIRLKPQTS